MLSSQSYEAVGNIVYTRLIKPPGTGTTLNARAISEGFIPANTAGYLETTYTDVGHRILFGAVEASRITSFMNSGGTLARIKQPSAFMRGISNLLLRIYEIDNIAKSPDIAMSAGMTLRIARDAAGAFTFFVDRHDGNGLVEHVVTGVNDDPGQLHMGVVALNEGSELADINVSGVPSAWSEVINFTQTF